MPRILGVDVPGDKRAEFSLRYVYGIGPTRARQVIEEAEIPGDLRAKDLTDQQINRIIGVIQRNRFLIEGDLRRDIQQNLKRLQSINCYRGIRHRKGLPVRGQRTSTNARTRKGPRKTVGVIRSKDAKSAKT
ncbi:30S ribosomal protein S13 [bacterium]|nr:30S ribosomal protein S13 [bacterium]